MFGKKAEYPNLGDVQKPLEPEQLRILRDQVESEKYSPNPQSQFNYAWGLIKSNERRDQKQGIDILTQLSYSQPSMQRECTYYLALGCFKLGDYASARQHTEALLKSEPSNTQVQELKETLDDKIMKEGLFGLGIAGGVLAVGIGLISSLARRKR